MKSQVVSKQRVSAHGEVLTGQREVNAMLDLVGQETQRIESRFLEPACGNGNFLAEILERKLAVVESRYSKSQLEYERYAVLAVSTIYGIDLLEDNVQHCRNRLFGILQPVPCEALASAIRPSESAPASASVISRLSIGSVLLFYVVRWLYAVGLCGVGCRPQ